MTWTSAFGRACGWLLDRIVHGLALTRISPNALTFIGLVINIAAAFLFGHANATNGDRMFFYAGLVIFGAGPDVPPLVRLAKDLGWQVTVADPRPAGATPGRFPEADGVLALRPEEVPADLALDADTLVVVMTHRYRHDVPLLRALLPLPLAYLGLLGPRQRAEKILSDLVAEGFEVTPEMRARLHAPVGLDLGAEGPEEVALAILAEMTAVRAGRDGRPLRDREKPIHG